MEKEKKKKTRIQTVIEMNTYFEDMKKTCEKMLSIGEKELRKLRKKNKRV